MSSVQFLAEGSLGCVADDHLQSRRCLARLEVSGVAALLDSLGLWPRLMLPLFLLTLLYAGLGQLPIDRGPLPLVLTLAILRPAGCAFIPPSPTISIQIISEVALWRDVADHHDRFSRGRRGGLNFERMCFEKNILSGCCQSTTKTASHHALGLHAGDGVSHDAWTLPSISLIVRSGGTTAPSEGRVPARGDSCTRRRTSVVASPRTSLHGASAAVR